MQCRWLWVWTPGEIEGDSRGIPKRFGCNSQAKLEGIRGGFEGDSRGIRGDSEFGTSFSSKTFVAAGGIQLRKVFTIKILIKETEAGGRRRASTC